MLSEDVEEKHYARFEGLAIIVEEIARINETVDRWTNASTDTWKTGGLCHTMPAGGTTRYIWP